MSNYTKWVSRLNSDQKANSVGAIVLIDDIYGKEECTLKLWTRRNKKNIEKKMKELGIKFKPWLSSTYIVEDYSEAISQMVNNYEESA